MFPIKYEHEHFLLIFCLMHHERLYFGPVCIFLVSNEKKKGYFQILLFQLGVSFQSYWICGLRHEAEIQQQEVQNSTETVKAKLCCVMGDHHKQIRPLKKALTVLLSSITPFAAVKHEPCSVLNSTSKTQGTT